jgi:septum formation topological specificity factor MinE
MMGGEKLGPEREEQIQKGILEVHQRHVEIDATVHDVNIFFKKKNQNDKQTEKSGQKRTNKKAFSKFNKK